jgi:valyl-tRNA synthetase
MDDVPFRDVYIHALVRDAEGQKMSKSRGNVLDPVHIMDRFGTDAFRFTLAALAAQGRDIRMSEERVEGYRNFANKIWNAARLVLANLDGYDPRLARRATPTVADRWIRSRLARTVGAVRRGLDRYRFNDAASAVYQFLWHELCDWYLELAKARLYQREDPAARALVQRTLVETLETTLRLLHPFMPFLTEEIWQRLPHQGPSIMVAPFPRPGRRAVDPGAEAEMEALIAVVTAIRAVRSERRVSPGAEVEVTVRPAETRAPGRLHRHAALVGSLARARVRVDPEAARPPQCAVAVAGDAEVFVHLAGAVDLGAERQRLARDLERAEREIAGVRAKLGRPEFVERAPAEVVARERARLAEHEALAERLRTNLAALG